MEEYFNSPSSLFFSDNTPKLDKLWILKDPLQCGICNFINKLSNTISLTSIDQSWILNGLFTYIMSYHTLIFRKYWSTDSRRSSKYWHISLYNIVKIITNISNNLIRKVFKYWKMSSSRQNTTFPEFWFLLESSNFIITHKCCQLFSLKWQACFIHFQRNVCQASKSE